MVFPILNKTPIPEITLSAAGLVALADLQTIAHRTALTGTSSWFDALVLAPGLHYQQAADGVASDSGGVGVGAEVTSFETGEGRGGGRGRGMFGTETLPGGGTQDVRVTNPGMLLFLSRLGVQEERARERELRKRNRAGGVEAFAAGVRKDDKVVFLDVGTLAGGRRTRKGRAFDHDGEWELERGSHLLYLASPLLTTSALTIMILLADWWGLAAIIALITSRLLNIYIIKQRTPPPPPTFSASSKLTEYAIPLSPNLTVRMRGPASDLAAVTTETWLLSKTAVQGYLEAVAKLAVYMVAVFSGNVSQAGNMVLLVLLLGSAGLLGLSNGFVKGVRGRGRVARVWKGDAEMTMTTATATATDTVPPAGSGGRINTGRRGEYDDAFAQGQRPPLQQGRRRETDERGGEEEDAGSDAQEWVSQAGTVGRDPYAFDGNVE
ncbi:uncharacterized protein CTRU02_207170 [Colletotrichum truncatum]|uniref:Uncharacterized protein n=1 Tax=Colletotrichum truncatum TaxID=5467 RepID=A0ACC3Z050_COLTU|nr:uncharacterized protein CTRU02_01200 [Colletotrichum truncatum]KAF6800795.1 hypothetical protein CTRU02_01200 [Colletotrichum truncatum]